MVRQHFIDVLAGEEHRGPLAVVHDRAASLEALRVVVRVQGDVHIAVLLRPAQKLDVAGVEQVERATDVGSHPTPRMSRR